jgi:hypothetical protein
MAKRHPLPTSGRRIGFRVPEHGDFGQIINICPRCFRQGVDKLMSFITGTTDPIACARCGRTFGPTHDHRRGGSA